MQLSAPLETDLPLLDCSTSSERFATSLDDAVIHFRCGDLMNSGHGEFDFLTFKGYTRYISPEARTIGILTQPFSFSNVTASGVSSTNAQVRLYDVAGPKPLPGRHPRLDFCPRSPRLVLATTAPVNDLKSAH
jgi:hypothetical protein